MVSILLGNYLANRLILCLDEALIANFSLLMLHEHLFEGRRTEQATNLVNAQKAKRSKMSGCHSIASRRSDGAVTCVLIST